jgi:glutamine synthetase
VIANARFDAHASVSNLRVEEQEPVGGSVPVSARFGNRALTWQQLAGLVAAPHAEALRALVMDNQPLAKPSANALAAAVLTWAVERGATHYSHWFHPLTGIPADKHDSFLGMDWNAGNPSALEDFSGSVLVQGEPDASSFPSGGLRSTAQARGYTGWDPTSPIFVRADGNTRTLCIPCAFVSWKGHALDHKVPLLRARAAVERSALRLLGLVEGPEVAKRVLVTLGLEQEYFLVDKRFWSQRADLVMTGRTLLGAAPSRGQQLEDHYFAAIPARVQAFVAEAEEELWALGVPLKTRHNEVAPAQFETAPVFEEVNVACDHNALTMDVFRRVADRHGLVCLFHEKPFAGVNGSGKHNNWSLSTDTGINLLDPGDNPASDPRFLLFLGGVLLGLQQHAAVLRTTIASAGNDHRLGANEAPPPILSAYLGEALDSAVLAVIGARDEAPVPSAKRPFEVVPGIHLRRDPGDRNRTSPVAFTGNKFEFRAVGSSENCAWPQAVLNAAVADALAEVADRVERALAGGGDRDTALMSVAQEVLRESRSVCFDGNGYSAEWREEAARRGLPILQDTAAALPILLDRNQTEFLQRQGVLTTDEVESRAEIYGERYVRLLEIEALTLADMVRVSVVPAIEAQISSVGAAYDALTRAGVPTDTQRGRLALFGDIANELTFAVDNLEAAVEGIGQLHGFAAVRATASNVVPALARLRSAADRAELHVADAVWPLPRYRELLFLGV